MTGRSKVPVVSCNSAEAIKPRPIVRELFESDQLAPDPMAHAGAPMQARALPEVDRVTDAMCLLPDQIEVVWVWKPGPAAQGWRDVS